MKQELPPSLVQGESSAPCMTRFICHAVCHASLLRMHASMHQALRSTKRAPIERDLFKFAARSF